MKPKPKPKRAAGGSPITVAEFLSAQIDMSELNQREIAEKIGYSKPNILTMFKQGLTKVPLPKVAGLAKALNIDPVFFMRMVLREYQPEIYEALTEVLGDLVTHNEAEILAVIREATGGEDPKLKTSAQTAELKRWAKALV